MSGSTSSNLNRYARMRMQALQLLVVVGFLQLFAGGQVYAKDNGDDIIMTKGKLILRGGKGRGNLIVDTGAKSHEHHEEPMMHHFNPYPYYPMHEYHHQHLLLQPMMHHEQHYPHHNHQEEQHHQEYHHEIPQHHYEHHEANHEQHYQPEHYSGYNENELQAHPEENHEKPHHMDIHESTSSEQKEYNQQEQPSQQEETTAQQYGNQGIHSMAMMMHGSGNQPTYQQLAALQLMQNPNLLAHQQQQLHLQQQQHQHQLQQQLQHQQQLQALQDLRQQQIIAQQSQQQPQKASEKPEKPEEPKKPEKPEKKRIFPSLLDSSSNSPLATIMKPLLSLNPMRFRKKEPAAQQDAST